MIHGAFIPFLGALPLIVANPLPPADPAVDWKDSNNNQLLSTYLDDPNAGLLSLVPNLDNQGSSLPSIDFDTTSTHDSLESIAATDPGPIIIGTELSAAAVCENEGGVQPGGGVKMTNNAKLLRKRQEESSCASQYKKSQPPTLAPPKPIVIPDTGELLLKLPSATGTGADDNECKEPFVNHYCCDGPLGQYISSYSPVYPHGFYREVDHCVYCKFLRSYVRCNFFFLT